MQAKEIDMPGFRRVIFGFIAGQMGAENPQAVWDVVLERYGHIYQNPDNARLLLRAIKDEVGRGG